MRIPTGHVLGEEARAGAQRECTRDTRLASATDHVVHEALGPRPELAEPLRKNTRSASPVSALVASNG
ncbi:MAG: hypothetical protein ACYCPT_09255 [Acidimicrobiales bacterium]